MVLSRFCGRISLMFLVALLGCGDQQQQKQISTDEVAKIALEEIAQCLRDVASEKKTPPKKLADLGEIEPMLPTAGGAIRNGEIIYFWGSAIGTGDAIIAHSKNTPTSGGAVLLQNGTIKTVTAEEFKSMSKASGK